MSKQKKGKHYIQPRAEDFEEAEKAEHGEVEEEGETENIYDAEQRETMLDNDEISASEEGFMRGRDGLSGKKEIRKRTHDDSISVELAKKDTEED